MAVYTRHQDGVEVLDLNGQLADGSLKAVRQKFAQAIQHERIRTLIREVETGTIVPRPNRFYLGNWKKGEIQITGILRITTNRYWTEIEYHVLFPPKPGQTKPNAGTYRNLIWNPGEAPGCCALLLSPKDELVVLHSFRHAVRSWCFEVPIGARKPGETDEQCAIREATEECGLVGYSRIIRIGTVQPDTGMVRSNLPVFAFTDAVVDSAKVSRDISESEMGPRIFSVTEYQQMVRDDKIQDARLLSSVEKARAHGLIAA